MPPSNRRPLYSDEDQPASAPAPAVAAQAMVAAPDQAQAAPSSGSLPFTPNAETPFRQPCTLKGVASAAYAGALGYFLGFVPAGIRFKGRQWGMIHAQGMASASQLAIMSGMYTAVHCICQRIRMVEDGWNRGIAGCSTGLVLGWKAGPWSAVQSCAGIGLLSALIDLGGGAAEAAEASMLSQLQHHQVQAESADNWVQLSRAPLLHPSEQQQQQLLPAEHPSSSSNSREPLQWQLVAAAQAAGSLPAAVQQVSAATQQLLAAVPPLAYLSVCCSAGPAPPPRHAGAGAAAGLVDDAVDACKLVGPVAKASSRPGRSKQ